METLRYSATRRQVITIAVCGTVGLTTWLFSPAAAAREFAFFNITALEGGPGQGSAPELNDRCDIVFCQGTTLWLYDRSEGAFLNVTGLAGAPGSACFPKLNNAGNVAMIETGTRDLWLFEGGTQTFTNISSLGNFPATGNSQADDLRNVFDINDDNKISFHSGANNSGRVYVYDHASGTFEEITNKTGGSWRGRQNDINNAGQVAYMGFPSAYLYDPSSGTTTNVSTLPGGPGGVGDKFDLNDPGDLAIHFADEVVYYEAAKGGFLYLSTLPGWPGGSGPSSAGGLSDRGEITFWRTELYYFNPVDQTFTQLNNRPGVVPAGGLETSISNFSRIALAAGLFGAEDVYLAIPLPLCDFDGDGDVDQDDFSGFKACCTGPGILYDRANLPPDCALTPDDQGIIPADLDRDSDVDQTDFGMFQRCLSGQDVPADPSCAD